MGSTNVFYKISSKCKKCFGNANPTKVFCGKFQKKSLKKKGFGLSSSNLEHAYY
jgi:hypothetical protein